MFIFLFLFVFIFLGAKVKTKHLGYWKKVKGFGECARDYTFPDDTGATMSIQVTSIYIHAYMHIHTRTHTDRHKHTHTHTHTKHECMFVDMNKYLCLV